MKKYSLVGLLLLAFWFGFGALAQSNTCHTVSVAGGSVCIRIEKTSNNQHKVHTNVSSNTNNPIAVMCDVEYGSNYMYMQSCNLAISHNSTSTEPVRIRLNVAGNWYTTTLQYNFSNGTRSTYVGDNNRCWNCQPSYGSLYDLNIQTNTTSPTINQYINLDITALQSLGTTFFDYQGSLQFSIQERINNSWQSASTQNYTLSQSYYNFSSSNNGRVLLNNALQFSTAGQYRLVVQAQNSSITKYVEFNVGGGTNRGNNTTLHNFGLSTSNLSVQTNQAVNVTIQARNQNNTIINNYNNTVQFSVHYRANTSSSWQTAPWSYYSLNQNSYSFSTSNWGSITLNNLVSFYTAGLYRLSVYDTSNNVTGYLYFTVGSSSNTSRGFTTAQMQQVQSLYAMWPTFINYMRNKYPNLNMNSTWNSQQSALYQQMLLIIQGNNSIYSNYNQFFGAFTNRYIYTLQVK